MTASEVDFALLGAKANFEHAVKVLANPELTDEARGEQVNEALALAAAALLGAEETDALDELGASADLPCVKNARRVIVEAFGLYVAAVNQSIERQNAPEDDGDEPADGEAPTWVRHLGDSQVAHSDASDRLDEAAELISQVDPQAYLPDTAPDSVEACTDLLAEIAERTQ